MQEILNEQTTWYQLGLTALWLTVLYVVLGLLNRWLRLERFSRLTPVGRVREHLQRLVNKVLILFELGALATLLVVFIFINPIRHGVLAVVLLVAGFPSLKNFINGHLLMLNSAIASADRIRTARGEGNIAQRGRFGFYVRTVDGLLYLPYSQLVEEGFALVSGQEMGSLCHLQLSPRSDEASLRQLPELLLTLPYLDRQQPPIVKPTADDGAAVTLLLREARYLPYVLQVLAETGWEATAE